MAVSPNVTTTKALGIHQSDVIIRSALVEGIEDLRRNPWLLDYCFASLAIDDLTKKQYGIKEIEAAKRFFLRTEIPVFMSTRIDNAKLPCISIMLQESVEMGQTFGDVNYEPQEETEADWPALVNAFTPTAYVPTTGYMTLPAAVTDELIPATGMIVIDANGGQFMVLDVIVPDTGETILALSSKNIIADFRTAIIKGSVPRLIASLESVTMRETYSIGVHVQGQAAHLTYLHSIVVFILLRKKQDLLEARGFESSSISSAQFDRDRNTEEELAFARYISITGNVKHWWPKNVTDRIEQTVTGITVRAQNDLEDAFFDMNGGIWAAEEPDPTPPPAPPPSPPPAPFGPADIAGLRLQLESDGDIEVDGLNEVTLWTDASPQSNSAVSSFGGIILSPAQFGALPGLDSTTGFSIGFSSLASAASTNIWDVDGPRTLFVVANVTSPADATAVLVASPVAFGGTRFVCGVPVDTGTVFPITDGVSITESTALSPTDVSGVPHIYRYKWAGPGNAPTFAIDGVDIPLTGLSLGPETAGSGYAIFKDNVSFGAALTGVIGAVIAYDTELSSLNDGLVEGYLSDKYGVPV